LPEDHEAGLPAEIRRTQRRRSSRLQTPLCPEPLGDVGLATDGRASAAPLGLSSPGEQQTLPTKERFLGCENCAVYKEK